MAERINVLVVDDDPMILDGFRDYFGSQDRYTVITAYDGGEALKICGDRKVDFCFTDLNMPGMDGIELAGKIRDIDNTIPVVVMTGYPSSDNAIAVLKTGGVDFLVKPFRFDSIGAVIQNALGKRDLFVENMLLKQEIRHQERLSRINRELREKVKDLNALNLILEKIDWSGSSSALFDRLVRLCTEITGGDESYFHLLDDSSGAPGLVALWYGGNDRPDPERHGGLKDILAEKMKDGMPLLMNRPGDPRIKRAGIYSLIASPLKIRENPFGVVSAVKVGTDESHFTERDLYYLNFMARRAAFVIENAALYENIYENLFATLYAFVEAIEARDPYTKQHSSRVSELALAIGTEMGCQDEALERLRFSGYLHDIGKIGIPDRILLKPGRLTADEFEVIKKHPTIGAN
ncbi:MAG: response regulator, partial [Deltaproteobacteria bacterium]|nr:response regulator [Deltaproteobacteria bacterium]